MVSRSSISRSITVARVVLYSIVVALIAVSVMTSFAQPPKEIEPLERNIAPELAKTKAERFERIAALSLQTALVQHPR